MSNRKFENKPEDIVIVSGARTAVGKFGGSLKTLSAIDMGSIVVAEAVKRAGIDPAVVDECIIGQVGSWGENGFVARAISLKAGLPNETCAYSVNRQCGSGLQSIADGIMEIKCGQSEVVVAGGAESLSQLPYYVPSARWGARMGHKQFEDGVIDILTWPLDHSHNGITAENVAARYHLSREELDAHAVLSQQRAAAALEAGVFDEEIVPVHVEQKKKSFDFARDEFPRPGTTMDVLGKLRPAFKKDGVVTAGNASGVNDGAAALVLMDAGLAAERGLSPLARIVGWASAGVEPDVMGLGPIPATRKALEKAGWTVADLDQIEANEAFAAQFLAVGRELGFSLDNVNINGGAIALGHPIGASGARILVTLLHTLKRKGQSRGLATLCIGGGQGIAMLVERG